MKTAGDFARAAAIALAAMLAGCSGATGDDEAEPGLTRSEESELDDAAAKIDAGREAYETELAHQAAADAGTAQRTAEAAAEQGTADAGEETR